MLLLSLTCISCLWESLHWLRKESSASSHLIPWRNGLHYVSFCCFILLMSWRMSSRKEGGIFRKRRQSSYVSICCSRRRILINLSFSLIFFLSSFIHSFMEYLSWNGHLPILMTSCLDLFSFHRISLDTSLEMQLPFHAYWTDIVVIVDSLLTKTHSIDPYVTVCVYTNHAHGIVLMVFVVYHECYGHFLLYFLYTLDLVSVSFLSLGLSL